MQTQLRMLIDLFGLGEPRVFGLEPAAADPLFALLAGGTVPSIIDPAGACTEAHARRRRAQRLLSDQSEDDAGALRGDDHSVDDHGVDVEDGRP